jgi:hypothetical protein
MRPRRITLLAVLLAAGPAAACSVSAPGGASFSQYQPSAGITTGTPDGGDASPNNLAQEDAGTEAPSPAYDASIPQSNMLCLSVTSCDPDVPVTAVSCNLAPDGGAFDPSSGYSNATLACRVEPATSVATDGLGIATTCSVSGAGMAGTTCKEPTDCAAGFDCVGEGSCRHYCCAGNSQCSSSDFCDVQALASAATTKVPVCMPIEMPGCDLLSSLSDPPTGAVACPAGKTCAIVREDGTTGCVDIGPQGAGESCDRAHCEAGLACLGALNARKCYALCDATKSSTCTAPMMCQGGLPLFQDPSVGVCR